MAADFERVNSLVEATVDLPPHDRAAALAAHCGSDANLLAAAESLLALSDSMDGFLDRPAAPLYEIRPGDLLGGRFRVVRELGTGGTGAAYLAEDRYLGEVAIKTVHPEMSGDVRVTDRFLNEVRLARAVRHPNVCPVFDLFTFEHDGGPVSAVTMKHLHGETLARRLARGPLPVAETLCIANGIGAGIDALHGEGIIHRDLKPDNIMLTVGRGGGSVPVIMDLGLATQSAASPGCFPQVASAISGSPDYMAPEQFRTGAVTAGADIYAFGLILFEMITGVKPFPPEELLPAVIRRTTEEAPRLRDVSPAAADAWDEAIAWALSRDASARPLSARQLLAAMELPRRPGNRAPYRCEHRFSLQYRGVRAR